MNICLFFIYIGLIGHVPFDRARTVLLFDLLHCSPRITHLSTVSMSNLFSVLDQVAKAESSDDKITAMAKRKAAELASRVVYAITAISILDEIKADEGVCFEVKSVAQADLTYVFEQVIDILTDEMSPAEVTDRAADIVANTKQIILAEASQCLSDYSREHNEQIRFVRGGKHRLHDFDMKLNDIVWRFIMAFPITIEMSIAGLLSTFYVRSTIYNGRTVAPDELSNLQCMHSAIREAMTKSKQMAAANQPGQAGSASGVGSVSGRSSE